MERATELGRLDEALAGAVAGTGTLIVVEGPAGIGKTRLLRELRERAAGAGAELFVARGTDYEQDFAFGVARQLFERRLLEADASDRLLRGAAGLAALPLGLPGAVSETPSLDSPDPAFAALHGLYWLVANLAAERPLVLVVDDAHWADLPSLRFCSYLARRLEDLPVLLAVGARPGGDRYREESEMIAAMAAEPEAIVVRPAELSVQAVSAMAAEEFEVAVEPEFASACHEATGGVPFFVTEVLRALASDGVAPVSAERERVRAIGPPAVTRSVLLRIGALPPPAASLVSAIAVLGTEATLARAATLAGLKEDDAAQAADALAAAQLLAGDGPLSFAHPIIAATVEAELRPAERSRLHAAAARLLHGIGVDPSRVAHLLAAADPIGEAWSLDVLRQAAAGAVARGAPQIAARLLRRALAEPPPAADRPAVLAELGEAELRAGDPAAVEHLRASVAAAPSDIGRASLLARAMAASGRGEEAVELLGALADELAPSDAEGARLLEGELASIGTMERALAPGALQRLERHQAGSRDHARGTPGPRRARPACVGDGREPHRVRQDGGASAGRWRAARRAVRRFSRLPPGGLCADRRRRVLSCRTASRRRTRGGAAGAVPSTATRRPRPTLRSPACARAAWPTAEGEARAALDGPAHALITPMARAFLVFALAERGEVDEAEAVLEPLGELPPTMPANHAIAARARVAAQRGDWAAVRLHCEDAERRETRVQRRQPDPRLAAHAGGCGRPRRRPCARAGTRGSPGGRLRTLGFAGAARGGSPGAGVVRAAAGHDRRDPRRARAQPHGNRSTQRRPGADRSRRRIATRPTSAWPPVSR